MLGHGGDDVIFGDQDLGTATGGATIRESLNWNLVADPNGPNPIGQQRRSDQRLHPEHGAMST